MSDLPSRMIKVAHTSAHPKSPLALENLIAWCKKQKRNKPRFKQIARYLQECNDIHALQLWILYENLADMTNE